jgi:hypothetical protein
MNLQPNRLKEVAGWRKEWRPERDVNRTAREFAEALVAA